MSFTINAQRFLAIIISCGLLLLSPGAQQFVVAQTQADEYELLIEKLDKFAGLLQELRNEIDRSQFDIEALGFELAFEEPETIVTWVRDNIAFEQYLGLLRGAQGTLISRAGNALDQAVLLATLLKDTGYEVRVARGTLTEQQAHELLQAMVPRQTLANNLNNLAEIKEIFTNISRLFGSSEAEISQDLKSIFDSEPIENLAVYQKAQANADNIINFIASKGLAIGEKATTRLLLETQDYFWVEYRIAENDVWQQAHPTFPESEPSVFAKEYFADTIPPELQHRVRVEITIEQQIGDTVTKHQVMDSWEKPAANLVGVPLTYTNFADGFTEGEVVNPLEVLEETTFFYPVFNSEMASGAMAFDHLGNVVPADAASNAAAGVFQNVASDFGSAIDALENEDSDNVRSLIRQTLHFTISSPNGHEQTFERDIFDSSLKENNLAISQETSLLSNHTFMIASGYYSDNYLLDNSIETLTDIVLRLINDLKERPSLDNSTLAKAGTAWRGHLTLFSALDAGAHTIHALNYRSEPGLVLHSHYISHIEQDSIKIMSSVDIVNNTRRAFTLDDDVQFAAQELLRIGTWETHAESLAIQAQEATEIPSRQEILDFQPANFMIYTPAQEDEIQASDLSASIKGALIRDLQKGYTLLLPSKADSSSVAWWRINLATGETLGMMSHQGYVGGQSTKEYIIIGGIILLSFGLFLYNTGKCRQVHGDTRAGILCFWCGAFLFMISLASIVVAFAKSIATGLAMSFTDKLTMGLCVVIAEYF